MRLPRTSIAGLMGLVVVTSLGLAALRSGSSIRAGVMFLATCGVLALAVVGAVCRAGRARAWWLGFALFGWGYLALALSASPWGISLPTVPLLIALAPRLGIPTYSELGRSILNTDFGRAGHCLFGLLAAMLGGLLAVAFFGAPMIAAGRRKAEPQKKNRPPRPWWRRPAVVVPMGLLVAIGSVSVGLGRVPGPTAAVVFFITWGMLFLAAVGAAFGPRERRASWLGAALFGIGYMTLVFRHPDPPNWPHVATDRLLRDIREQFPWIIQEVPEPADVAASNARILKALDTPISMSFPQETPLDDVLKYIKSNTQSKELGLPSGIPIYVDPLGLNAAERTQQSPVVIDVEGVPLRTALHLVLNQMGLTYGVGGGVLVITGVDTEPPCLNLSAFPAAHQDPFLVVGHCLLASLAAGLGGLLAPKVCKWGRPGSASNLGDDPIVGEAETRLVPTGPALGLPDRPGPVE